MNGDINALRIDVDALIKAGLPANLLASLLTVDGAGSGLDADKLDGVELSTIYSRYDFKNLSTENLNDLTTNGVYLQPTDSNTSALRNYPRLNAGILEVFNAGSWITQRYTRYSDGASFTRYYQGWGLIGWKPWSISGTNLIDAGSQYGEVWFENGLLLQWGTVAIRTVANTPAGAWVTFPYTYDFLPSVFVSANTSVPGSYVHESSFSNLATSGCNIWVYRTNSTAMSITWLAIGYKA
jgi:hypothetical protein